VGAINASTGVGVQKLCDNVFTEHITSASLTEAEALDIGFWV
jgi:hypothetical protein